MACGKQSVPRVGQQACPDGHVGGHCPPPPQVYLTSGRLRIFRVWIYLRRDRDVISTRMVKKHLLSRSLGYQ